ncbi:hypothetical protein BU24DRAFT_450093 [Aaosphaeria arxii CBS 175.79]|uniref:Zn(2)-C6 fungal-type domain-containing protein n=1 Tax=Aaosphaeria arxii CBS 175.79 TaxID=1450172 RepID=A0A6A5XR32_9PLEO|nr:uncharacterized protein BU24DRAFT_450093 [Aaosphaeria arxii CBS 175.79]KAF2015359.1 hypothetical protein BU24DRAFT_450093 [Aaosphaeria arxii CBS 175.79]
MRAKRKNVCQNCRAKKLACDGAQPECSQCIFRQIGCSGYRQEFVFVSNGAYNSNVHVKSAKRKEAGPPELVPFFDTPQLDFIQPSQSAFASSGTDPVLPNSKGTFETTRSDYKIQTDIQFIKKQYEVIDTSALGEFNLSQNQICGAWVDVLPLVVGKRKRDEPLLSAIGVMATAFRYLAGKEELSQDQVLDLYCESLRNVGKALEAAHGVFQMEHCAAIMCLAVTDIVSPKLKSGWMTHAKGVGDMMEALGPASFRTGAMHTIFVGFRPLLVISSILTRRRTFLARKEWNIKAFDERPVSILQLLLDKACELPELLERYHGISDISLPSNLSAVEQLWYDFHDLLTSIRKWARKSHSEASHPLFWSKSNPRLCLSSSGDAIWFPNMMTANSLMHYWALEIVIRTYLNHMHKILSTVRGDDWQTPIRTCTETFEEYSLVKLADMICDSISYLLQPELKVHGLGSAFFALPTALRIYEQEQSLERSQLERYEKIPQILASKGMYFPSNWYSSVAIK